MPLGMNVKERVAQMTNEELVQSLSVVMGAAEELSKKKKALTAELVRRYNPPNDIETVVEVSGEKLSFIPTPRLKWDTEALLQHLRDGGIRSSALTVTPISSQRPAIEAKHGKLYQTVYGKMKVKLGNRTVTE